MRRGVRRARHGTSPGPPGHRTLVLLRRRSSTHDSVVRDPWSSPAAQGAGVRSNSAAAWADVVRDQHQLAAEAGGDVADVDDAIRVGREAAAATADHGSDRAGCLINLGVALRMRFEHAGRQADLDEAVSVYARAWESGSAAPSVRMRAARAAAQLLALSEAGRARAADLLEAAVRLLPEAAPRQLACGDQQYALGGFAGLAGDAAALVLAAPGRKQQERADQALRLLEAGRAVLLGQVLDTRSDVTVLHEQHPEMAALPISVNSSLPASR
ncbi:hypothetical protein [Streptomyces sp. NPDC059970]|uniref:hypothetical protein n=1 Tax=Streptomyces sp. NPDC059970 TaxID=3347019 RepID=UPI0036C0ABE2